MSESAAAVRRLVAVAGSAAAVVRSILTHVVAAALVAVMVVALFLTDAVADESTDRGAGESAERSEGQSDETADHRSLTGGGTESAARTLAGFTGEVSDRSTDFAAEIAAGDGSDRPADEKTANSAYNRSANSAKSVKEAHRSNPPRSFNLVR